MITFTVRGIPAPQGSKTYFGVTGNGKPRFGESSKKVRPWRSDVRDAALVAMGGYDVHLEGPLRGPIAIELAFRLPRPKSHFLPANSRRPRPELRPSAPIWPAGKPDIDKITRSTLDAMSGLIYADDSQVVDLGLRKRYADGEPAGVTVTVRDLERPTTVDIHGRELRYDQLSLIQED